MAVDDRLSDLLVEWEQARRGGQEPSVEELCRDTPDLLPVVRESIASLRATAWMFEPQPTEPLSSPSTAGNPGRAALHDTELPASHLTAQEFAASIFQSGLLSRDEIDELRKRLGDSALPGEAREIASKLVSEGKLTRYQAAVLLKASKDPLLIDNYVILDTLDTGGMGLVFKALHRSMNRVVALKLLPAAMMSARDTVKRFQREVQAAAALKHPNVVAAYDADESEEIAYLVLEYVDGTNLYRLVKEQGPQPLAEAVDFVRQAAAGLGYLHSRGIIHRDVKPANLLLAKDGTVKLLDMGLVRFASSEDLSCSEMDQELTQAGIVIGTVAYMSPEQALDTRSADQRSDIYSLGCTLFYLLTGRSLYHEETGMKTLLAHREQPVPSLREFCEEAPVSLDAVFRTMVAKRPADRLQSMDEVIAALDACVPPPAAPTARVGRPVPSAPQARIGTGRGPVWKSRRFRIGAAVTALAAAVLGSLYLAVIVIRIKTAQGTTEVSTNDPNAKIEIASQPQGPAVSQLQSPPEAGFVFGGGPSRGGRRGGMKFGVGTGIFPATQPAVTPLPPVPIVTATVRKGDFDVYLSRLSGTVSAPANVQVRTVVDGVIQDVLFVEGQIVRAGQPLFQIDDRLYKTRLAEAEAKLTRDQAALVEAKKALERVQSPAEAKAILVPRKAGNKVASDPIKAAGRAIHDDQALLEAAKQGIAACRITAPITGRIGLRYVDKGSLVTFSQQQTLAFITPLEPVTVMFPLPLDQVFQIQQKLNSGKEVVAEAWDQGNRVKLATGKLTGTNNQANPVSGTVEAKCVFANEGNRLFPLEPVKVRLLVDTLHDAVIVPTEAVHHGDGGETFAWVVKQEDQTVEKRKLVTGPSEKKETVVTSGLSPGEIVVIEGANQLVKGSKVITGFKAEDENPTAANSSTGTSASTNLDRQVAQWVLANRGTVRLKEFRGREFQYVDALPPTDFHIEAIDLKDYVTDDSQSMAPADDAGLGRRGSGGFGGRSRRSRMRNRPAAGGDQTGRTFHRVEFSDADLDRLASLPELRWLYFASAAVTDDTLARLKGLTKLESLGLEGTSITDAGLASLLGMSHLTMLNLDSTAITDAGLKEIAKLKSLNDLSLIPEAERSGRRLRSSPTLRLSQTRTTVSGIDELQRAAPNCIVFASHLGFSPAPPAPGSSDREWAQWLFPQYQQPTTRQLFTDLDPDTPINTYEELPPVDFHIVAVRFNSDFGISETMVRRMAGLTKLRRLHFGILMMPAFAGLGDLKQLEGLSITNTDAAGDALQVLANLLHLKSLELGDKYFTEEDLVRLAPLHDLSALSLGGHWKALHGSGFGALSALPHLKTLDLDGLGIEDEALAPIGKLVTLEHLSLSRTWITGTGLASLVPLSRLKSLRLNGCHRLAISSLEVLTKFPHLESLGLNDCPIDDSAVELLKKLSTLRDLSLPPNPMSPTAYQGLQSSLPNCNINGWGTANSRRRGGMSRKVNAAGGQPAATGSQNVAIRQGAGAKAGSGSADATALIPPPPPVGSTDRTWAEWLLAHISGCTLRTDVDPDSVLHYVKELPPIEFHITRIGFSRDEPNTDSLLSLDSAVLRRLNELPALEAVSFNPVPKSWLPALPSLIRVKSLSLQRADNLGDEALKPIGTMTNLTQLRIESQRITDAGLKYLAPLRDLTGLFLINARNVHGSGLKELSPLTKLQALSLSESGLDDAGLAEVARFPNLQLLDLNRTWISPKGLAPLAGLANLKHLELDGCRRIDDSAIAELSKLKHLQYLNLYRTRVTNEFFPELKSNLPPGCSILSPMQNPQQDRMRTMMEEPTPKSRRSNGRSDRFVPTP